jgi:hypothetical protein
MGCIFLLCSTASRATSDRSRGGGGGVLADGTCLTDLDLDTHKLYGDYSADSNTYIYRSGADEWTMVAGGVDAAICDASYCTFASGPMIGASIPFADAAGTLTLQNVDALDGTTLATIVAAISSNGSEYDDDVSVCWGDDDDFCIEHDTDGTPDRLRLTQADCDGSPCAPLEFYKEGGTNVVAIRASSVTNPDAKMTFGPPGASSYGLGANDSHFTGKVEITGNFYAGNASYVGNVWLSGGEIFGATNFGVIKPNLYTQTINTLALLTGSDSNYIFIGSYDDSGTNFGITKPNDNAVIIQSIDETDVTKHSVLFWNRLALGGDGGGLGCINQTFAYDDFVDGGGVVGTLVLDEGIPNGAVVQRAILHTLVPGFTGGANSTATVQIGDGTDPDRYNTGTPDIYTTNASGVDLGVPSGTAWHDDAKNVTVTATVDNDWSTISAGEATVVVCYWAP